MSPSAPTSDWDQPSEYEEWYASPLGQAYLASLENVLVPWLAAAPHATVLDVGCGPGLVAKQLFPASARVIGVDCSFEMARRARAHAERVGQPHFVFAGSVEALPFADESVELVLSVNCLEFVDDQTRAFREIARVLAPCGVAIVGVLNRRSSWELTRRLRRPFSRQPYYRGRFFTDAALRSQLCAVGLSVEHTRTAVHFPPLLGALLARHHERAEKLGQRWFPGRGAVLLCRAAKKPVTQP